MTTYQVWYADDKGNKIAPITDLIYMSYSKVVGGIGVIAMSFPKLGQKYDRQIADRKIIVYRRPTGGTLKADFRGRLRGFATETTLTGVTTLKLDGRDSNEVLARRIVPFYASSSDATIDGVPVDDAMKDIVTRNFVNNADYSGSPSDSRSISTYLSVQDDKGEGTAVDRAFSWRNVLDVLQDLQAQSRELGNEIYFALVDLNDFDMQFRTYSGQLGLDRTETVRFSLELGNLVNPMLRDDYVSEVNAAYAGGRGTGQTRLVKDQIGEWSSVIGRREGFAFSQSDTDNGVLADAQQMLIRERATTEFTAMIIDSPVARYGVHWDVGYKVSAYYAGRWFTVMVTAVNIVVDSTGKETIRSRIESV